MYICTINKTVVLDWYHFNTCIIQHFVMVNVKFNFLSALTLVSSVPHLILQLIYTYDNQVFTANS